MKMFKVKMIFRQDIGAEEEHGMFQHRFVLAEDENDAFRKFEDYASEMMSGGYDEPVWVCVEDTYDIDIE